jgi:hypothetical protein
MLCPRDPTGWSLGGEFAVVRCWAWNARGESGAGGLYRIAAVSTSRDDAEIDEIGFMTMLSEAWVE